MVINMIYDHLVKYNGKYYAAGEEVPENEEPFFDSYASDENIVLETGAVVTKTESRRGRPKKTE